jgi:hypothetical protein
VGPVQGDDEGGEAEGLEGCADCVPDGMMASKMDVGVAKLHRARASIQASPQAFAPRVGWLDKCATIRPGYQIFLWLRLLCSCPYVLTMRDCHGMRLDARIFHVLALREAGIGSAGRSCSNGTDGTDVIDSKPMRRRFYSVIP